jgi:hypothetical protein
VGTTIALTILALVTAASLSVWASFAFGVTASVDRAHRIA